MFMLIDIQSSSGSQIVIKFRTRLQDQEGYIKLRSIDPVRCSRKLQAICPNLIVYLLLFQVNLALSVIYSRHLLAILLGNWCDCGMITSELIDNSDEVQLIGLLDILQKLESKELFEKVSFTLVACHRSKSSAMWVVGGGIDGFNHLLVSITNADSVAHELWGPCRSLIM